MDQAASDVDRYREADAVFRADLEVYSRKLIRIRNKAGRLVPFVWKRAQRELHVQIERQKELTGKVRVLVLKGRRMGISTYIAARFDQRTTMHTGHETFILTHRADATDTLFGMVKLMHREKPFEYRLALEKSNATELVYEGTDSMYRVGTAGGVEIGRSMNNQSFHGSELAFWENASTHFAAAIETVPDARDTEVILESTANGIGGEFYDRWQKAEKGIGDYIGVFLPWFWDDEYRREVPGDWGPPGEWAEYQDLNDLDLDQVYWGYQRNIALGGDPETLCYLFHQEYPSNAEEAFQTSSTNTLIKSPAVVRARKTSLDLDEDEPLIFGVDIAATDGIPAASSTGATKPKAKRKQSDKGDSTRLISRRGRVLGRLDRTWRESDTMIIADNIALEILRHKPDRVFIDKTGIGWGVVDNLRRRGHGFEEIVHGILFGANATESNRYKNKRAEMWSRLAEWIDDTPSDIPDDNGLHRELCSATWKPDVNRRVQLEDKELIKRRLGFSPDGGDAAALTFAEIITRAQRIRPTWVNEYYAEAAPKLDPMTR